MDGFNTGKKYEPFKIPNRKQGQGNDIDQAFASGNTGHTYQLSDDKFYEIEYGSCPIPGVGKFVMRSQKIKEPEKDGIADLFEKMREISRSHRSSNDFRRLYERRVSSDNALVFYKQGLLMKDFSDNYSGSAPFSQYFPYYQMMGYEQLRTYFTWRTEVRKGNVADTSLSYAFLYIYELLDNIGVANPQDGLEKLMCFWQSFRAYNATIDKYIIRWLKDYHIYYELPQSFKEFANINNLIVHYPRMIDADDSFDLYCSMSKYDIKKSAFFTNEKVKLTTDCFFFVIKEIKKVFLQKGVHLDEYIFQPTRKLAVWTPFKDALFYQWVKQRDRRIVLSENEIYICSQNKWTYSTIITSDIGKQLIGYIIKQTEVVLRRLTKFKSKLSANINTVSHSVIDKLKEAGISLEDIIDNAVVEFYREATKTVVKLDIESLSEIRQEALATQEKLIVSEQAEQAEQAELAELSEQVASDATTNDLPPASQCASWFDNMRSPATNEWDDLKSVLTETELRVLSALYYGEANIKKFADECGIMLEVLIDGINEKAMDYIGDNLIDNPANYNPAGDLINSEFVLLCDYKDKVKEMVG